MSPRKRSIFKEPTVVVAIITAVVGGIITGVFALISKAMDTPAASSPTNSPLSTDNDYAMQLLAEAQHWPLVVKDGFDTNKLEWPEGDKIDENVDATRVIKDGHYSWRLKSKVSGGVLKSNPVLDVTPNFYYSVDAQNTSKLDTLAYGITFRDQGAFKLYSLTIYPDQHFIVKYRNDSEDININLASLKTKQIMPYETNRMAVIAKGQEFWFYINDSFVHYLKDDRFSAGTFGIVVTTRNISDEGFVEFDNLELRKAP